MARAAAARDAQGLGRAPSRSPRQGRHWCQQNGLAGVVSSRPSKEKCFRQRVDDLRGVHGFADYPGVVAMSDALVAHDRDPGREREHGERPGERDPEAGQDDRGRSRCAPSTEPEGIVK